MTVFRIALAAVSLAALAAPSLASPALTVARAPMRQAASPYAPVVQAVPANAEIDVHSCAGAWCYGSWRGLYGFLPAAAVGSVAWGAAPPLGFDPPPPPLVPGPPVLVAPQTYHWSGAYFGLGF